MPTNVAHVASAIRTRRLFFSESYFEKHLPGKEMVPGKKHVFFG
jgi:hypothetical protein